jgi:hypothetical protein
MTRHAQPWMLFVFPAVMVVAIIGGFVLGGPGLGFAVAVLIALIVVGAAIRMEPRGFRGPDAAPAQAEDRGWQAAAIRRFLVPVALGLAGLVAVVLTSGTAQIIAWGVVAIAVAIAISLLFLEVGLSEDRARAQEQEQDQEHRRW